MVNTLANSLPYKIILFCYLLLLDILFIRDVLHECYTEKKFTFKDFHLHARNNIKWSNKQVYLNVNITLNTILLMRTNFICYVISLK